MSPDIHLRHLRYLKWKALWFFSVLLSCSISTVLPCLWQVLPVGDQIPVLSFFLMTFSWGWPKDTALDYELQVKNCCGESREKVLFCLVQTLAFTLALCLYPASVAMWWHLWLSSCDHVGDNENHATSLLLLSYEFNASK